MVNRNAAESLGFSLHSGTSVPKKSSADVRR
jgi:hypothetical protein